MLPALGHHSFISGDDEKNDIYTTRAGKHILNQTLMARDIDYAYGQIVFGVG